MNATGKNVLAAIVGFVVMMGVNMGLVQAGPHLVPLPEGVDIKDLESFKANVHRLEPKHFAMAWLAHGLGSLAGGFVASLLAATRRMSIALGLGTLHLLGGIAGAFMIPAPAWFIAVDLIGAYLPMAWLGGKAAELVRPTTPADLGTV